MKSLFFILLFSIVSFTAFSKNPVKDTLALKKEISALDTVKRHSPRKAALFSLVLPGMGQAYNKQFIKIPIIYALGTITIGLAIKKNQEYKVFSTVTDINEKGYYTNQYNDFLFDLGKDNPNLFKTNRDEARNDRDKYILYTGLVYMLNIVDAIVSAHLKEFTVSSDDLALKAEPTILFQNNKATTGFALTLRF